MTTTVKTRPAEIKSITMELAPAYKVVIKPKGEDTYFIEFYKETKRARGGRKSFGFGTYVKKEVERLIELYRTKFQSRYNNEQANKERKRKAKEALKGLENPYKVGDLFYSSWGYDQTNINFFKVVKTTKRTLTLVEVAKKTVSGGNGMLADLVAAPEMEIGEPVTKKLVISTYGDEARFYVNCPISSHTLSKYTKGQTLTETYYA